jgi:hypothetical protein
MPLEDLVGSKYVSDLNEAWPLGTDLPDSGDDHLRGIKNVLKKTFPNITGPVTRTQTDLNNGSVPSGSLTIFCQAAAPVGWTRSDYWDASSLLKVVPIDGGIEGGTTDGTDNPIIMQMNATLHYTTGSSTVPYRYTDWTPRYTNVIMCEKT